MNARQYEHINYEIHTHNFECRFIPELYVDDKFFLSVLDNEIIDVVKELKATGRNPLESSLGISGIYYVEALDGAILYFFWFMLGSMNYMFANESKNKVSCDHSWLTSTLKRVSLDEGEPVIHKGGDLYIPKVKKC